MASYELTLSPNYVPKWGANEAFRELFQNGIDREIETDGDSRFFVSYDALKKRLMLGNSDTVLSPKSLLLGETTKIGRNTIGQYGEGYKLALLVMLRLGMRPVIENYNEIWVPRIKKSRRYGCDILVIDTHRNKHTDGYLRYIIDQVSPEQWSEFQARCLRFHTLELTSTHPGNIVFGDEWKGKIFCSGLFVCEIPELHFGYDMKPGYIQLNRDRNRVDTFNMTWETSRMWAEVVGSENLELIHKMVRENAPDVEYYNTHANTNSDMYKTICDLEYKEFLKTHGTNAVVCRDEQEANVIRQKYGNLIPIIVPEKQYKYITGSPSYKSTHHIVRNEWTPENYIRDWLKGQLIDYFMVPDELKEELINEARKWSYKPGDIAGFPQRRDGHPCDQESEDEQAG